ncbi:peptidylprolyl isomerase [Dyella sp. A6]|uniref:peptidylprolyl isomerase n=1 Tax=Dyella aluminiiresistens TaxID=3069105 RepID=UPI002E771ACB|nr:peptidylprolyl isomerase [Dyella sp. A6]
MKQTFALLLLAITFAIAPLAHAQLLPQAASGQTGSGQEQRLDRIVAVVGEDVILQSELDRAVHAVQQQYAQHPDQLPPLSVLRRQVLDRLILMKLQLQHADDQGIHVSDQDVDRAVQAVAQQNKMTPDQLRQAVEQTGQSFADFRQQLHDQLVVQRLHQSVVQSSVNVTQSEVDNLLNSPAYKAGEVHLAHIEINVPAGASAEDISAAAAKAKAALDAIKGGMNFQAAAIRYSDATDALDGGDLGWRRMDAIPPAFLDTIANMEPGQVSPALRGPTGFHILKLLGRRKPAKQVVTEYHALHILIKPTAVVTMQQAGQKAEALYRRIVDKHASFAKLAEADSDDDTTANNGGDMGWFQKDAWGSAIGQQVTMLKDGEVSKPFQTAEGWHIVKRLGERQTDVTEQDARAQARQAIGNRKAEQAYDNFLRELRSRAYVKILVPSLASDGNSKATP